MRKRITSHSARSTGLERGADGRPEPILKPRYADQLTDGGSPLWFLGPLVFMGFTRSAPRQFAHLNHRRFHPKGSIDRYCYDQIKRSLHIFDPTTSGRRLNHFPPRIRLHKSVPSSTRLTPPCESQRRRNVMSEASGRARVSHKKRAVAPLLSSSIRFSRRRDPLHRASSLSIRASPAHTPQLLCGD